MATSSSQFLFRMLLPVLLVVILASAAEGQRPGCREKCGNITIPFPFGIGLRCFREGFEVLCNHSRAFLAGNRTRKGDSEGKLAWSWSLMELASISVATSDARAYAAVSYRCSMSENTSSSLSLRMDFAMSSKRNVLQGVGWIVDAQLSYEPYFSAAADGFPCSVPESNYLDRPAGTNGSCVAPFPPDNGPNEIISLSVQGNDKNRWWETYPCSYGMLVEESVYSFSTPDIRGNMTLLERYPQGTPFILDFAAGNTNSCPDEGRLPSDYACVSGNSSCANATTRTRDFPTTRTTITRGYVCKCWEHYDGNPYIPNGCQYIDECKLPTNPCPNGGICKNRLDGYDCPCKFGMKDDGKGGTCTDVFPPASKAAVGKLLRPFINTISLFRQKTI
ncbi:wall-associated receptor kinase 3-like [Aegilops tauschii subsp. strangulata]|uniref:wall-associated receptor kinase 3-like n=1 Tax=Aegilops tauschii subsp. strangulata TaxID=200361 RepID=UPI003CC8CD82